MLDQFLKSLQRGESPRIEELIRDPQNDQTRALTLELIRVEVAWRRQSGQSPTLADYLSRFPHLDEHQVRDVFQSASLTAATSMNPSTAHDSSQLVVASGVLTAQQTKTDQQMVAPRLAAEEETLQREFGRYLIERELGHGGMGTVYLAHDRQLGRKVALKIPFFRKEDGQEVIDRFYREARAMATVRHANLCSVHDVGQIDGQHFLAMEYIDGHSLSHRLNKSPRLTGRQSADLIRKVALALHKAHLAGVIHRDLKPGNIMIDKDGEPVITDFGLARILKPGEVDLTHSGMIMGSPAFMSPEQVEMRTAEIGPAADVWSLGVMLYQMLTGVRPFEGSTAAILGQIVTHDPVAPSQIEPVERMLEAICLKAISKPIALRFTTAIELADALQRFLETAPATMIAEETRIFQPVANEPPSSSPRRRRDAERRQVTIAVFNHDPSLAAADAEIQQEMSAEFARLVASVVTPLGGAMLVGSGQEVQACFGFPVAYEDSAQRAVQAGLQLRHALSTPPLSPNLPSPTSVWCVIHTGDAVAEELESDGNSSVSVSVIGDARNTALKLDAVAEPGLIVISSAVQQRIGMFFECESLGARKLRGAAQPIELFSVVKEVAQRNRVELIDPGNLTPLVGRDTELSVLKDRWDQSLEHLGQIVLLIGEAGLGKSRLIREIREHISRITTDLEPAVIEFRCSQYQQTTGFFPAIEFLLRLLDFDHVASPAARLDRIDNYLQQVGLNSFQNLSLLAALLSVPTDDRFPALNLPPQRKKELTQELLRNWLQALSAQRPVLFIVEDLHWVDPSTLEMLARQVQEFGRERMLNIYTFRPEFETPWKSKPHQTQIALNRLTRRQIGDMMHKRSGGREIPDAIVTQVAQRTDGVPLFIEEFTNLVLETGILDGTGELSHASLTTAVPATLQDLLLARLDRMDCNPEVVQLAATIGREFSYALLAAACDLPAAELQQELSKLVHAVVLFQKGRLPDAEFIFKHALIQDSAYNALLKKKRQQFHRRIAEVLEQRFPDIVAAQPALLARHFTEAGLIEKGIAYWLKAGRHSQSRSAVGEAMDAFDRGLELIKTLPDGPTRDAWELQFQMPRGAVLVQTRGYGAPEPGAAFAQARALCESLGQQQTLALVIAGMWGWHLVRADLADCLRLGNDLQRLGEELNDDGLRVEACWAMTCTLFYLGRFEESAAQMRRGNQISDAHPDCSAPFIPVTGQNAAVCSRGYGALSLFCLGQREAALQASNQAIELARRTNDPFSLSMALYHGGWLRLWCGLRDEMQALIDEGLRLARQLSFTFYEYLELVNAGAIQLLDPDASADQLEAGLKDLAAAREAYMSTGGRVHLSHIHTIPMEALLKLGRLDEARSALQAALQHQTVSGERCVDAELHRWQARIHQAAGNLAAARASLNQAARIATDQSAQAWAARITETTATL